MTTRIINRQRTRGARETLYIGRGSDWGNPFTHLTRTKAQFRVATKEIAIARFRLYLFEERPDLLRRLFELSEQTLGCYCKPRACHGDVLIDLLHVMERGAVPCWSCGWEIDLVGDWERYVRCGDPSCGQLFDLAVHPLRREDGMRCRHCHCSENEACWDDELGPCSWADDELCSHCAAFLQGKVTA